MSQRAPIEDHRRNTAQQVVSRSECGTLARAAAALASGYSACISAVFRTATTSADQAINRARAAAELAVAAAQHADRVCASASVDLPADLRTIVDQREHAQTAGDSDAPLGLVPLAPRVLSSPPAAPRTNGHAPASSPRSGSTPAASDDNTDAADSPAPPATHRDVPAGEAT